MSVAAETIARARAVSIEDELGRRGITPTLRRQGHDLAGPCPLCGGEDRFAISTAKQCWNCRQCKPDKITGDVIGLVQWLDNCGFEQAIETLTGEQSNQPATPGKSNGRGAAAPRARPAASGGRPIVAIYDYVDGDGALLYQVCRQEWIDEKDGKRQKSFLQRRPLPGEPGRWIWGLTAGRYVRGRSGNFYQLTKEREGWQGERRDFGDCAHGLYRFAELRQERASWAQRDPREERLAIVAEGEKDVDTLRGWGFVSVCNSGGAGKWTDEHAEHLRGADAVIMGDNDDAGRKHVQTVAASLANIARSVRVLDWKTHWPDIPDGGDVTAWRDEAGGTGDKLLAIIGALGPWTPTSLIKSSAEFIAGYVPPDYILDGLLQQGFLYSLTGQTGAGKTSVTMRLAASTALGIIFAGRETKKSRVLYLAAENPDDARMRWIALAQHMFFDPKSIEVFFSDQRFTISKMMPLLRAELDKRGGKFGLVIVDTGPSFFEGDDENNRVQMGAHARMFRNLIGEIPGHPCIIVNCHPVKNAGPDNLLPAGGGTFLNEMDGNLTAAKPESTVELHWQGKFRGPDFAPTYFLIKTVTHEDLKDTKGRLVPTCLAEWISEQAREEIAAAARDDQDRVLKLVNGNSALTLASLALAMGWKLHSGDPNKMRAKRIVDTLIKDKLIEQTRAGRYKLTKAGGKALKEPDE
jgi:hypothetical protein